MANPNVLSRAQRKTDEQMSFLKLNSLAILVAATFFGLAAGAPAQSEPLKWKLAAGDKFEVVLIQASSADTKVGSRKTLIENSTTLKMNWDVLKVANGDATIEQSIAGISLNVNNPAIPSQAIAFDTAADEAHTKEFSKASKKLLKQIQPLIGLKFNVTMAATGEIKEVTLPPESTTVINQLPDTVRLRQLFSAPGLTEILGASAIVFPEKAIESGDSWTDEKPVTTPLGEFTRNRTYTVVGNATVDGEELIEVQMKPTLVPKETEEGEPAESAEPAKTRLDGKLISFTGSGKLLLDSDNGYLKSSSFANELKSERAYREKTIETVVKNEISMTVNKLVNEK